MSDHLNFGAFDYSFIVLYLVMLLGIGWWHSRKPQTLREYFLAGKHMSWIPIGLSLMAALNSGIDYMAQPSALIKLGAVILTANVTWFVLYPYVFYITAPLFRRLDVYSAYEYLENRFNVWVRCLTAFIFLLWRLGWMAMALYVPCLALTTATGHPEHMRWLIAIFGVVATVYTMMGGVKAVIWTEVLQFVVMFGGLFITIMVVLFKVDFTFTTFWETLVTAGEAASREPKTIIEGPFSGIVAFLSIPATWTGFLVAGLVGRLAGYTSDQVMVQRFQTAKNIRSTRQGFLITAFSDIVWMTTLAVVGVMLVIYFRGQLAAGVDVPDWVKHNTDYYFPYFMARVFPPGLTGPVMAAIVAASLSAIASAINSQSSVIIVDFYNRLVLKRVRPLETLSDAEQRTQVLLSRVAAISMGLLATLIAMFLDRFGELVIGGNRVVQTFTGPVLGIFWLGMFTRRANGLGVFIGGFVGTAVAIYVAFWLEGIVSFLWPSFFGLVFTLVIGYFASWLAPSEEKGRIWNWFTITGRPLKEDEPVTIPGEVLNIA